jgi:NAD-dependent SIR2 family protein deacetylase
MYYFGSRTRKFKNHKKYSSFIDFCKLTKATIITTDRDIIAEKVLKKATIQYEILTDAGSTKSDDTHKLIKLHGFIDWLHCNNCGQLNTVDEHEIGENLYSDDKLLYCKLCVEKESSKKVLLKPEIITPTMNPH